MVKQGFLNLTSEEQNRIIDAALDEFADKDFEAASLNSIIARAGISKGSMYHYFANEEDPYLHIIDRVLKMKELFLRQALAESDKPLAEMSFFENLEFQMLASVDFAVQHYRQHKLSIRLQNMAEGPLKERLIGDLTKVLPNLTFNRFLNNAIMRGKKIQNKYLIEPITSQNYQLPATSYLPCFCICILL